MLNKDYTSGIQNAIRNSLSLDFTPVKNKLDNLPNIVSEGLTDWDKSQKRQAYIDALESGDTEAQDKALAAYNPEAYADILQTREKRQQALDDMQAQRDFQRELADLNFNRQMQLEGMRNANARSLAEFKAGLGASTTAQRNVKAMIDAGYSPEEAWAMYYGGQNPTLNMEMLGKKGLEAYDKKTGEALADKTIAADLLKQTESAYDELFGDNGLVKRAKIGADMPDTVAGRLGGIIDRSVPTSLVDSDAQQARQQIQYILGGLRLDESSAMKGALSDSEQKFLSDMVAGNVKGYSPWEIEGAFKGIMNKLRRKADMGNPSLKQFEVQATDEDAWGI